MTFNHTCYQWTKKDKQLYVLSLVPFFIMFISTLYLLILFSFLLPLIWISLYLIVNIFQAVCCIGCPYRGKYCPAFCGVYLGNLISSVIYYKRQFDADSFKKNALGGEISLIIFFLFPIYWIFLTHWYFVVIYFILIVLHIVMFMPIQCKKCSYNSTCPGGKAYHKWRKLFKIKD